MNTRALLSLVLCILCACGSAPSTNDGGENDSGQPMDAGNTDAGTDAGVDAGLNISVEVEPNDGSSATALNAIVLPAEVTGVCNPQSDLDIFTANMGAGEFWQWKLDAAGSSYAPHIAIHDVLNKQASYSSRGATSQSTTLEFYAPVAGGYAAFVRDSRNVPTSSSQNVGGPAFTYKLTVTRSNRTATPITLPTSSPVLGTLSSRYGIGVYTFTLASPTALTLWVKAKTKSAPSDIDTFASLYRIGTGTIYKADDFSASNTDSQFHGTYAADTYVLVVNNVNEAANDLTYEVSATSP